MDSADSDYANLERITRLSQSHSVWLQVGQLLRGDTSLPWVNAHLIFDSERIHYVADRASPPPPQLLPPGVSEPHLVLPRHTVLPCLVEAHAHMFLEGAPVEAQERAAYLTLPAEEMLSRARARWPNLLRYGIAAIRDAGDKHGVSLALAQEAKQPSEGASPKPWIDSPGSVLYRLGRYGAHIGEPVEDHDSIEASVAARVGSGADRIKLLVTDTINFKVGEVTAPPQFDSDEVKRFVEAANQFGKQTMAYASGAPGIKN